MTPVSRNSLAQASSHVGEFFVVARAVHISVVIFAVGVLATSKPTLTFAQSTAKSAEEKNTWVTSEDGKLSLRFAARPTTLETGPATLITVELRNNTMTPINVVRPFGAIYLDFYRFLEIRRKDEYLKANAILDGYRRAVVADFATIKGSTILATERHWANGKFFNDDEAGEYQLRFLYAPNAEDRKRALSPLRKELGMHARETVPPLKDLWTGEMSSPTITVKREG